MKIPRYRMKMNEKLFASTYVSACLDEDVKELENRIDKAVDYLASFIQNIDPDNVDYSKHPEIHAMSILLGVANEKEKRKR